MTIAQQIILNSGSVEQVKFKADILCNQCSLSDDYYWYCFKDESFIEIVGLEVRLQEVSNNEYCRDNRKES